MQSEKEFEKFLENLKIKNSDDINTSIEGVTKKCNHAFRELESETDNRLNVGSIGRETGINGTSDIDIIYDLPSEMYDRFNAYETKGQSALLQEVKVTLLEKYPNSDISADGQVVVFEHSDYKIELVPGFKLSDGSYRYPDTNDGGSWKITKPKEEIDEITKLDADSGGILKKLCQMVRSWKNRNGVPMGGLLIDTLCYNFLKEKKEFHSIGYGKFGNMSEAFFIYLAELNDEQEYWFVPGSNQKVYSSGKFNGKAKKAKKNCKSALDNEGLEQARKFWKRVFGRAFPVKVKIDNEKATFRDTEEFIEDEFPVNIRSEIRLDCKVTQDGFRPDFLSNIPFLKSRFDLEFVLAAHNLKGNYDLYWKVKNIGSEAEKRDLIRGQIFSDKGFRNRHETSDFNGEHYVECYAVQNNVVVARDMIEVNIAR